MTTKGLPYNRIRSVPAATQQPPWSSAATAYLSGSLSLATATALGGFVIDVDHAIDDVLFNRRRDLRPTAGAGRAALGHVLMDHRHGLDDARPRGHPHVAQNTTKRRTVIDARTTRHAGYGLSLRARKLVEGILSGEFHVAAQLTVRAMLAHELLELGEMGHPPGSFPLLGIKNRCIDDPRVREQLASEEIRRKVILRISRMIELDKERDSGSRSPDSINDRPRIETTRSRSLRKPAFRNRNGLPEGPKRVP